MISGNGPPQQTASVCSNTKTDEKAEAAQGDKTAGPKSHTTLGESISHRAISPCAKTEGLEVSETCMLKTSSPEQTALDKTESPFKADDITIYDTEFKQPPGKIKKLALAIKIFSKSFKTIHQVNHPETDRSSLVESIRSKVYTVTSLLFTALNIVIAPGVTTGLFIGIFILLSTVTAGVGDIVLIVPFLLMFGIAIYFLGYFLVEEISNFFTSAVSAMVDTREKLTEITAVTLPEGRFLKKYQRMEKSLFTLRTKLYAADFEEINSTIKFYEKYPDIEKLRLVKEKRDKLETDRIEAGIPDPGKKLFLSLQYYCLRKNYRCDRDKLKEAIQKTEDWLKRAAKQKEQLTNKYSKLQEINKITHQTPTTRNMEVVYKKPPGLIPA